jgi:hypothetical protein
MSKKRVGRVSRAGFLSSMKFESSNRALLRKAVNLVIAGLKHRIPLAVTDCRIEPMEQRILFSTLALYHFNETSGTTAADSSGSGFNATLVGGASFSAGHSGNALTLNGTSGYANLPNSSALNFTGPITLSAWIKPTSLSGYQNIIDHGYTNNPDAEVYLRINNGDYQVGRWDGKDHDASFAIPTSDLNTWVHLSGEYDGSSWRLYRDGVLVAGSPDAGSGGAEAVPTNWTIGAGGNSAARRYFSGQIDDVEIDNTALSNTAVEQLAGIPTTLAPGVSDADVGTVNIAGDAVYDGTTWTVIGSGHDIWSAADGFNFASESMTGD